MVKMERLTYKSCFGDYGSEKAFENEFAEKCALRNALGKYEDLGYTPDELRQIIKEVKCNKEKINSNDNGYDI